MSVIRDVTARLRTDDRKLSPGLRRARGKFKRFGKQVKRDLRRSFSKATGVLKTAAGIGGLVGFATIGRDVLNFEDKLQRVGSQALFTGKQVKNLRTKITQLSDATGIGREKLIAGADVLVNLGGGAALTEKNLDTLTTAMQATGAASEDIAGIMFALSNNLKVGQEEMKGVLSVIDRIGAEKSVPFKEIASELSGLTGQAKEFQIRGIKGTARLVAAVQVLRTEFKGTSEAATGIAGAMTAIQRKEFVLRRLGVEVRDKATGEFKDLFETIDDIASNKKIQKKGLINVLGRGEATRAVRGISQLRSEMDRLVGLGLDKKDGLTFLDKRAADRQASDVGRIQKAWNGIKNTLAKVLTPERITKFADVLGKLGKVLEFVLDNIIAISVGFAALKLGFFAAKLASLAAGATKFAGALGTGSAGIGLLAAAAAGFTLGTMLDEWLGLSDAISDALVNFDKVDARARTGFVRDRLSSLGLGENQALGGVIQSQDLTARQKTAARSVLSTAELAGVVKGGKIDREAASKFATQGLSQKEVVERGGFQALTENLIKGINLGLASRRENESLAFQDDVARAGASKEQISIKVTGQFRFDQNGLAVMDAPRVKKNRRSDAQ